MKKLLIISLGLTKTSSHRISGNFFPEIDPADLLSNSKIFDLTFFFREEHFFILAKDCANEKRKKRPAIDKVLEYFDRIFFIHQLHGKRKNVSDPMKLQMYYDQKNRRNSNPQITNSNNPITSMARDSMEIGARALPQHPQGMEIGARAALPQHPQGAGALIPPGGSTAPSDIEVPDLPAIIVNEESTEVKKGFRIPIQEDPSSQAIPACLMSNQESASIPNAALFNFDEETDTQIDYTDDFDEESQQILESYSRSDIEGLPSASSHLQESLNSLMSRKLTIEDSESII